jgi:hypothetical protein
MMLNFEDEAAAERARVSLSNNPAVWIATREGCLVTVRLVVATDEGYEMFMDFIHNS